MFSLEKLSTVAIGIVIQCLICVLLVIAPPVLCMADDGETAVLWANADSELHERAEQFLEQNGEVCPSTDEELLVKLRQYAKDGDSAVKVLFADALVALVGDDAALTEACALYSDAVEKGGSGASLGLARAMMMQGVTDENRQTIVDLLTQASLRGSAEADSLLSQLAFDQTQERVRLRTTAKRRLRK
jgi:hypothetical protein